MKNRGFTVAEIIVVIAIISVLSSVAFLSASSAKAKGRDAQRRNDVAQIQVAMRLYAEKNGTYQVSGSGSNGGGQGWFALENGASYTKSIATALYEQGFLPGIINDPMLGTASASSGNNRQYLHYFITGGAKSGSCIFAKLEAPTQKDLDLYAIATSKVSSAVPNNNGMNYAVCNDSR